jgi:hypothetical protein
MFRQAPVRLWVWLPTEQIMAGISPADLKTTFLAFFSLMASFPQALS